MIDPRRLLTFRAVVEERSFSRAAVALSLTQPAVSQQIRALELQLGTRLIERGRRGFSLTSAGELLHEHARAVHERLHLAERQLREALAEERSVLRVGAFPSALGRLVPAAIAETTRDHGPFELEARQGNGEEVAASVRDGSVHVGICFDDATLPRREHAGVRRLDLFDEAMLAAVGPHHRLARRRRIRLAELARDPWLLAVRGGLIERACLAAGFEPRIAYQTDDPLAIMGLVAADLTVTLVSPILAGQLGSLATPAIAGEPVRRVVYALVPPGARHPLVAPFLDGIVSSSRR
jgi:DNA-binding transcriptional LysR family regulator